MKRFFLFLLVLWIPLQAISDPLDTPVSNREDEFAYFSIVNDAGGYINQSIHEAFWRLLNTKYDAAQRTNFLNEIGGVLEILQEFQRATWQSALSSYFSKNNERSSEYLNLKERLLQKKSQFYSHQTILENAEKIIIAAANRSALDLGGGKFYITPEFIEENMTGIRGSYDRLRLLLSPHWKDEYKEYTLGKMNISLLSLYPPDEYHEVIKHEDEQLEIHVSQLSVDKNTLFEIGLIDYQKGDKKFIHFSPQEKEIYIQEFIKEQFAGHHIAAPLLSKGAWRGYEYSKATASAGDYHVMMMGLFVNDRAFYVKYITDRHLSLIGTDFNEFIKKIQIVDSSPIPA